MLKNLAVLAMALATVSVLAQQTAPQRPPQERVTTMATDGARSDQAKPNRGDAHASTSAAFNLQAPATSQSETAAGQENLNIQRKLEWFTGVLALVGVLQAITMLWQACLLRGTLKQIQTQANQMERQTGILENSVAVAQKGIEITTLKERARVKIEIGALLIESMGDDAWVATTVINIFNFGAMKAFPSDTQVAFFFSPSSEPQEEIPRALIADSVIHPTEHPIEKKLYFFQDICSKTIHDVNHEVLFAHIYGAVKYSDAFGDKYGTTFRYVWRTNGWVLAAASALSGPVLGGEDSLSRTLFGGWEKCGEEEDNSES
jgi:hypothetical protein